MTEDLSKKGWTIEEALRHLLFKDNDLDPTIGAQLEAQVDSASSLHHCIDNEIRRINRQAPLPDPMPCPVWGNVGQYDLRRGGYKWLRAAGTPLKEKLSSDEFQAKGSAGSPETPVQEITPQQWDSVCGFDTRYSAALGPRGDIVFYSLRIFRGRAAKSLRNRQRPKEEVIKAHLMGLGCERGRPRGENGALKSYREIARDAVNYEIARAANDREKKKWRDMPSRSFDNLAKAIERYYKGLG